MDRPTIHFHFLWNDDWGMDMGKLLGFVRPSRTFQRNITDDCNLRPFLWVRAYLRLAMFLVGRPWDRRRWLNANRWHIVYGKYTKNSSLPPYWALCLFLFRGRHIFIFRIAHSSWVELQRATPRPNVVVQLPS